MDTPTGSPSSTAAAEPDFAAFDLLVEALGRWAPSGPAWPPARRVRSEWEGVAPRLDKARLELSRVLVVGVVGGTGTGKSTLVNALAGSEVTTAGDVARPTTINPVVVAARDVDVSWLPLDVMQARLVRSDSPAVANIVLVDCPDPDTQAAAGTPSAESSKPSAANRNRDLLDGAEVPLVDRGPRGGGFRARPAAALRANPRLPRSRHPRRLAEGAGVAGLRRAADLSH